MPAANEHIAAPPALSSRERTDRVRRSVRLSTLDGCCYAAMWGLGEMQIAPLTLWLTRSEVLSGLVLTVPPVVGTAISLISPWGVRRMGSHKRWIVLSASIQVVTFLPLIVASLAGRINVALLFAVVTCYFAAAWCAALTWNTFIAGLVHPRVRARYFGRRTRLTNVISFGATLLGGAVLSLGQEAGPTPAVMSMGAAFACVFGLAAVSRIVSSFLISRQYEPRAFPDNHRDLSVAEFAGVMARTSVGRLITYILLAQFAVQISTPFVTPYLLREVGLETRYWLFGLVLGVQVLSKAVFMAVWGHYAHRRGPYALLRIGAIVIVPQPLLWLLPPSLPVLVALQVSSGLATAAFELGILLMLLRHVDDSVRTSVMARYQFLSTTASVIGSLIGAGILDRLGHGHGAYVVLFAIGCAARLGTLPAFLRIGIERKDALPSGDIAVEFRAGYGTVDQPVAASAFEPASDPGESSALPGGEPPVDQPHHPVRP